MLPPFNKRFYFTNVTLTIQDLYKYSWLLAQSEERLYTMPTTKMLEEMRRDGLRELKPIEESKPAVLDTPCIMAGEIFTLMWNIEESINRNIWGDCRQLHPEDPVPLSMTSRSLPVSRDDWSYKVDELFMMRNKWESPLCYKKRNKIFDEVGWVYLSVVRTETQGIRSSQGNGIGMFILKHGSREAAAATAFCDAGVRGGARCSLVRCGQMRSFGGGRER